MAFQPTLPFPVAIWDEHPLQFSAGALTALVPYKTVAGFWVFVERGVAPPAGASRGAFVRTNGFATPTTATTTGLTVTRGPSGFLYLY